MRKTIGKFTLSLHKVQSAKSIPSHRILLEIYHHSDGDEHVSKPQDFISAYDRETFLEPAEGALQMKFNSPKCIMDLETRLEAQDWVRRFGAPKPRFDSQVMGAFEFKVTPKQWLQLGREIDQFGVYRSPDKTHKTLIILMSEAKQQDPEDYVDFCDLLRTISEHGGFEIPESADMLVISLEDEQ
jgi:hypothetical protein